MTIFRTALLASVSLISFSAFADDAKETPTVVVSASRGTPIPINKIASSVTVISGEQIEREHKTDVAQILREVPGLAVVASGAQGQPTGVFMRGTERRHVLVIIDGVTVNDPSDPATAFDFSNLATDNIERIEVLRGPQSTLYGSQAIGGVINIYTKQGKGAPKSTAFAEYGRYNTSKLGGTTSGEVGKTSYSFSASNTHSSGISSLDSKLGGKERDGMNGYTFSGNLASKLTDNFTAKLVARYNRVASDFDNPNSFSSFPTDNVSARNNTRQYNVRAAGELKLLDGRWTQELGVSHFASNRDAITPFYDTSFTEYFGRQQYLGWRDSVDWVNRFKATDDNLITAGVDVSSDHFKYNSLQTPSLGEVNVDNVGYFIDDQWSITKALYLNTSARLDDHQTFGTQSTYKIAPGYNIEATGTRLKASYGTGFKAPSLSQLYDPSSGNPSVKPERSKGFDAGFEQALLGDKITFGSTYFYNNIDPLLGNNSTAPYATINAGKMRTRGFESVVKLRPSIDWTLSANHTYTISENPIKNTNLYKRPKHYFSIDTDYNYNDKLSFGGGAHYSDTLLDYDTFGNTITVKSHTLVDAYANYAINPTVTLYTRLDNLLDKDYYESYGYGQQGRSVTVGAKANF